MGQLKGRAWERVKDYWRHPDRANIPCARCGRPIDHTSPRYTWTNGRRRENPWALDVGHIVDRYLGGDHNLDNTQPEHARCSRIAGGKAGATQRWGTRQPPRTTLN